MNSADGGIRALHLGQSSNPTVTAKKWKRTKVRHHEKRRRKKGKAKAKWRWRGCESGNVNENVSSSEKTVGLRRA